MRGTVKQTSGISIGRLRCLTRIKGLGMGEANPITLRTKNRRKGINSSHGATRNRAVFK